MKYSNTVEYNISTKLDSSGLTKLQSQIKQLENSMQQMANRELLNSDKVQAAKTQLEGLNTALTNSFNSSLGILDLSKFRAELDAGGVSAKGLQSAFNMMGAEGQAALNGLTTQIANFNGGMERTSSAVDKVFTTFSNTFRWGMVSSFFSQFMNAIHSSIDYVKELDDSLTQIMLVTDYNRDSMNEFAKSANEAAKAVSMTTTGMTNASLIFAQQGYNLGQSQELATLSAKVANASQQDTATTSDQITAYMNAYGLENNIAELTQAMDNWALIANVSAADVGELAQASQRAASMANAVGVSGEQLAAQIATIESVTREAPEQIGNGLKTLYARFSDIAAGGEDEDGFTLGKVTSQLQAIGVQIFDQMGQIRDVGDIMEDLMVIWDDLDQTSKVAASQALAGKYQVNRFMALMDNTDMYQEYKGATGSAATGTLDTMNEEYAQSIEGRSARLQASLEGLFSTIFNTDDIYPWMDAAQGAVDLLQQFFDALGGGKTVLLGITALLTQAFSQNIARSINDMVANRDLGKIREQNIATVGDTLDRAGIDRNSGIGQYIDNTANQAKLGALSDAQYDTYMNNVQQWANAQTALTQAQEELTDTINVINMVYGKATKNKNAIFNDEGGLNTQLANEERANLSDRQLNRLMQDTDFSDVAEKAKEFSQSLQNVEQQMKAVDADSENYEKQMDSLATAIDLAGDKLAEFNALNVASDDMVESILSDLTSLEGKIRANGGASDEAEKEIAELISMIGRLGKSAKDMSPQAFKQAMLGGGDVVDKKKGNVDFAQTQTDRAEENALDAQKNIDSQQQIKGILDTLNAVQQLTFAWQAFQNLGSIWKNNKLSDGEKFLQTFMSLTSAILMMQPAIEVLSKKFGVLNLQQAANVLTSAKLTIAKHAETIAFGASSVAAGDLAAKQWLLVAAEEAATIATTALKTALTLLASPAGIIGIMGIAMAIGLVQAQAEEAKQQALDNLEDAKSALQEIETLKEKTSAFEEKYTAFKEIGEGGDELAQQARDIAQALKDAGAEEEANAIHLATLNAEARGTAESFKELAQEIEKAQIEAEKQANQEIIDSSNKVLENQDTSAKDVLMHQKMIKEYQEELNNLDPLDAGYEKEKERLEHLIDTLKNAKLAQEDLVDAAKAYQEAQGKLAGTTVAENQGLNLYAGGQQGKRMTPDSATWFENANLDYNSIERIYSNMVEGFSDLSNLEKAQFILETIGDEAGKAAAQLELLMLDFNNLDTNQIDHLQNQMAQGGLTFDQQQLLTASLDKDTTAAEFSQTIQDVLKEMDEKNTTFEVALSAKLKNPEQFQEAIRQQVESYEPRDSEIEQENYNSMADHFYENKDKMGEEGSGFENYSEELFNNAEALSEVIEDTLRYSDAIEEISDNFDDWIDVLNKGEKTSEDYVNAVDGLKDTFSDFLGIPEELSEEFVTTQENLDDLKLAAEGDIDAFERLQTAAAIDLAEQLGVDSDTAVAAVGEIQSALDSLGYNQIDIGETITFSDEALAQINSALDMLELDADQAAQFIESAFGFKVDPGQFEYVKNDMAATEQMAAETGGQVAEEMTVTPEITTASAEQVATDEKNYTDVDPQISYEPWSATLPVTGGGLGSITTASMPAPVSIEGSVPAITYNAKSKTAKETKTDTALATGVKAEQGGSGVPKNSHVNLKPGSSGTRTGGKAPSSSAPRPSSGRGGGGGKSCFVAGTLISTSLGFKPIEQIQKGNIVLSYNRSLGLNEYSEVLQTMVHDTIEPIYTLYIKDEQLRVTGIHRFLVTDKITCGTSQWVHAADLHVGQWVLFADGTWHVIHKIEVNIEHQTVYNFEVSGNHNYYVGRNQILAHNKGGGKGKKGGGGKAKTIEDKEKKDHQKDYYEEVSNQLEKTEKILSRIEKEEDRLIGDKARANQNKQLANLAKEIELNKEKHEIQQQELKDVDELIEKRQKEARELALDNGVNPFIPSARYDEDGVISNYEQMSEAIDNIHNELIDKYNEAAKAGNENLTKEIQKTIEKFDKYGQEILKNAQRHDKLQSEIEGTINELEALEDKMEDIRIAAFKAHQEAIDDLKDLRESAAELEVLFRDFNEDGFLTDWSLDDTPMDDMIKAMYELDNIYTVTEEDANAFYQTLIDKKRQDLAATTDEDERAAIESAIQYFEEQQAGLSPDTLQNGLLGLANQDLDKLRGWIEGTNEEVNPFGNNEAALWEAYEDAYKRATDLFKDWRDTVKDLRDSIIDTYNEQEDAIEDTIDNYDRVLDHLERIGDTYALYYGDDSYDNILAIMNQQGATMQQQLNDLTAAYNYWAQKYEEAVELGDEELIKEIKEKMDNAQDAMYDKAEELAEHWVDRYEKAVDASIQRIDTKLWGGGPGQLDLEDQTTIWELQKDYMDTYRDDVEKAYEIDQLRSKYLDLLNDAQGMSLQTQNKIRAQMQDQLNLLANQTTMSEYDVKLANARLEILQKQIALEDAQRNKNKMQLRRDTQGNYRYVYTAEQGDVKQAQDELNESQFDAYELTKNQTIENNDRAINLYQDYMNKMRDIANKYKDDDVARNAAMAELSKEYGKLLEALGEDFKDTTNGMYDVLTWMIENGTQDTATAAMDMMDQLYEKSGEVKENTGNDWRDLATQITTEVLPEIENVVSEGINDISSEADSLRELLAGDDGVLTQIGSTTDTLTDSLESATDQTEKWAQAVRDLFESFSPDNTKVQQAMEQLKQMEAQMAENSSATSALSTKYKDTNAQLQSKTAEAQHYKTALDFSTGAKSIEQDSIVKLKKGTYVHYDRYGGVQQDEEGNTGWRLPDDMWVKFGKPISGVPLPYSFYATGESLKQFGGTQDPASDSRGGKAKTEARHHQVWWFDKKELQKNVLDAMDTGGYTGDWNDSTPWYKNGKAAILHQKELVLNATDTQNILAAVDIIRNMTNASIAGMNSIAGFNSSNLGSAYNPVTEQRVEIQASFPNATDAEDIRQALIGLSDKAYQYAHRVI